MLAIDNMPAWLLCPLCLADYLELRAWIALRDICETHSHTYTHTPFNLPPTPLPQNLPSVATQQTRRRRVEWVGAEGRRGGGASCWLWMIVIWARNPIVLVWIPTFNPVKFDPVSSASTLIESAGIENEGSGRIGAADAGSQRILQESCKNPARILQESPSDPCCCVAARRRFARQDVHGRVRSFGDAASGASQFQLAPGAASRRPGPRRLSAHPPEPPPAVPVHRRTPAPLPHAQSHHPLRIRIESIGQLKIIWFESRRWNWWFKSTTATGWWGPAKWGGCASTWATSTTPWPEASGSRWPATSAPPRPTIEATPWSDSPSCPRRSGSRWRLSSSAIYRPLEVLSFNSRSIGQV